MKLTKNTVRLLVIFMAIALAGLIHLQVRLFLNNVDLKHEAFRRNVTAALNGAAAKIEEIDLRERFFTVIADNPLPQRRILRYQRADSTKNNIFFANTGNSLTTAIQGEVLTYTLPHQQRVSVRMYDELGRLDTVLVEMEKSQGTHKVRIPTDRESGILRVNTDSATSILRWEGSGTTSYSVDARTDTIGTIVLRVAETFNSDSRPALARRLRPELVDSVLATELSRNGIDLPVTYAVIGFPGDSLLFGDEHLARERNQSDDFAAMLFAGDFSGQSGKMLVRFPTYRSFLLSESLPELSLNILFLVIVIGCFWFAVRILVRQKEFTGRITDFINNMTHEFKTPLSTIALASEALQRPDILKSQPKIRRFNRIIGEEYARMRGQVDKILDMAALEEGEIDFHRDTIDAHAMITRIVEHVSLEATARSGSLRCDLKAERSTLTGDAIHLENVLRNILDNSIKYSTSSPFVTISTGNVQEALLIRISDRGIGIPKEHLDRVFDKYYRVPTGNVHDVKGFGLGLSYVRLVIEAHGGKVLLESEKGKGTTVTLNMPLARK